MFLNYSALESGKLVLQLRENDLRDCLEELAKRWSEAFQRKGVRLDTNLDPSVPTFKFDYQKVQQAAANLLDNSLKHTPGGGRVVLKAAPHFWERRVAALTPVEERRRFRLPRPNSVEVSVTDSGPGIAAEHHQEIFEDFVGKRSAIWEPIHVSAADGPSLGTSVGGQKGKARWLTRKRFWW